MRISKPFFYYLLVLSLAGAGLVLLATSLYGAGVSADAAKNMSTAASLLAGHGFFDHSGQALVYWPPLYPLLLAGISWLTGWDVFVSGWYLNVLVMAANVFLAGWLVYEALREKLIYAYLGGLFVLVSESAVRIHANVSSDPALHHVFTGLPAGGQPLHAEEIRGRIVGDDRMCGPGYVATLVGSQPARHGRSGDPGRALEGVVVARA